MNQTERVREALRRDIFSGAVGAPAFLSENQICLRYDAGKAPVREALRLLCAEGLLVSHPRKGFLLSPVTRADFEAARDALCALECACAVRLLRAAPRLDIGWDNERFHTALIRAGGSPAIQKAALPLLTAVSYYLACRSAPRNAHGEIVYAVENRDESALRAALTLDAEREMA